MSVLARCEIINYSNAKICAHTENDDVFSTVTQVDPISPLNLGVYAK